MALTTAPPMTPGGTTAGAPTPDRIAAAREPVEVYRRGSAALSEVLASIGLKVPTQGALKPELFNRILRSVDGSEHQLFINEVVLRSQSQAEYSAENYGHFGLNLRRYAHFTSPIRRYADLIVHRALIGGLKLGKDGLPPDMTRAELIEISARIFSSEGSSWTR